MMLQSAKCGETIVVVNNCLRCVPWWTKIRHSRLPEVIIYAISLLKSAVSFWNKVPMPLPRQYWVTFIYTKFSHIIDHYYSRTILNITDNNDIVLSKVAATEFVDNMIANSSTGWHCAKILCRWMLCGIMVTVQWLPPFK